MIYPLFRLLIGPIGPVQQEFLIGLIGPVGPVQ